MKRYMVVALLLTAMPCWAQSYLVNTGRDVKPTITLQVGSLTIRPGSDSANTFRVQDSAGANVLRVDTSASEVIASALRYSGGGSGLAKFTSGLLGTGTAVANDLSDFNLQSPSDGKVIKYNATSSKWEVGTDLTGGSGTAAWGGVTGTITDQTDLINYVAAHGPWANVRDYGATGDGSTDDTTAVQAAMAASTSVYFPPGTYVVTGLTPANGAILRGDGAASVLKLAASVTDGTLVTCGTNTVQLVRLNLDGGVAATYQSVASIGTRHAVSIAPDAYNSQIVDCLIHGFTGYGIYCTSATRNRRNNLEILGGGIYYCWCGIGTVAANAEYMKIANLTVYGCRVGLDLQAGNITVSNVVSSDNGYGLKLTGGGVITNNGHGNITGCLINHNTVNGLLATDISIGMNITGCCFYDGDLLLDNCRGIHIEGGAFDTANLRFQGGGRNVIKDNFCYGARTNTVTHNYLGEADDTLLIDNWKADGTLVGHDYSLVSGTQSINGVAGYTGALVRESGAAGLLLDSVSGSAQVLFNSQAGPVNGKTITLNEGGGRLRVTSLRDDGIEYVANVMVWQYNGQVGINTYTPTAGYMLDVNGKLRVANDLLATGAVTSQGNLTTGGLFYAGTPARQVTDATGKVLYDALPVGTGADTVAAGNDSRLHLPVTLGTANGLGLAGQVLSLQLASGTQPGALSATDWATFNGKQASGLALLKASNLSDLANVATARSNLGLGGAALLDVGTITGTVAAADDGRFHTRAHQITSADDHPAVPEGSDRGKWLYNDSGTGAIVWRALGSAALADTTDFAAAVHDHAGETIRPSSVLSDYVGATTIGGGSITGTSLQIGDHTFVNATISSTGDASFRGTTVNSLTSSGPVTATGLVINDGVTNHAGIDSTGDSFFRSVSMSGGLSVAGSMTSGGVGFNGTSASIGGDTVAGASRLNLNADQTNISGGFYVSGVTILNGGLSTSGVSANEFTCTSTLITDVPVAKAGGGTRTLHFRGGLYENYTDSP